MLGTKFVAGLSPSEPQTALYPSNHRSKSGEHAKREMLLFGGIARYHG
jgi:hypothetical protein